MRFWYEGEEPLAEMPNLKLQPVGAVPPKGTQTFGELPIANLGCLNDTTVQLVQVAASSPRFVLASVRLAPHGAIIFALGSGERYRKGNIVLTTNGRYILWGTDPVELLHEMKEMEENRDTMEGWTKDPVFWPEPTQDCSSNEKVTTKVYVLKEKPVVDLAKTKWLIGIASIVVAFAFCAGVVFGAYIAQ